MDIYKDIHQPSLHSADGYLIVMFSNYNTDLICLWIMFNVVLEFAVI